MRLTSLLSLGLAAGLCLGCGRPDVEGDHVGSTAVQAGEPAAGAARQEGTLDRLAALGDSPILQRPTAPWTGDLEEMRQRRLIRVLVSHSKTNFFSVMGRPRGFEYELLRKFEESLNAGVSRRELKTTLAFVPVPLETSLAALVEGRGDMVAAGLTITPERQESVAFTEPYLQGVEEIVVTRRGLEGLESLADLGGRPVLVRRGSSYAQHLVELSQSLEGQGRDPVEIVEAAAGLETEDILELVNAGAVELTLADRHVAELWSSVLTDIVLRDDLVVHQGGEIAWAVRKESSELRERLNAFVRKNRKGTLLGNILFRRYYEDAKRIRNPLTGEELAKRDRLASLFKKYADEYSFDWLAIAAQAFQESRFDHSLRSRAGAVGIMQLLPSTAADRNVGIPNIQDLESNVHAGVKYMAFLRERYFSAEEIAPGARFDFALAAYNAGPARVKQLRRKAAEMGLDPDRWFRNVEALQVVGQEPVQYVANINKYYVAYKLLMESRERRERTKARMAPAA